MNQEKIMQLEEIINTKYDNITGIIGLKNGVTKYENYFNGGNVNSTCLLYTSPSPRDRG